MKHASAKNIGYLITKCSHVWNQELMQGLRQEGFLDQKPSFGAVFIPLFDNSNQSTADIIRFSGLTKQTISIYLKELEKLGYISRKKDESDKRRIIVILTNKGKKLKKAAKKSVLSANNTFLERLGKKDFRHLTDLLLKCLNKTNKF